MDPYYLDTRRPAGLLERLLSPLARAESIRTWPPPSIAEHWERVEDYRRRYENRRGERLAYATEFSRTTYGRRIYTPVGLAREVCNFSAEMLFSAPPEITFEDDEELLEGILDANGLDARLTAIAAVIATEGRGGLRIINDESVADVPLITHVHEDEVIWDERHGSFVVGGAVIIERQPTTQSGTMADVYRLVEEHVRGGVSRRLYKGTSATLGSVVKMDTLDEFAGLPEEEDTGLDVPTLIRWDNVSGGYSDLAGAEAMLDRIDAEVSYGAEKSEKARPISYADASLFDSRGQVDLSGVIPIRKGRLRQLEDNEDTNKLAGTIQPDFQSAETIAWIDFLVDSCLMFMGYSKASYGRDSGGSADSGKALRLRQARTLLKKSGKDRMAVEAITNALAVAMAWQEGDGADRKVADYRAGVSLGDGLPVDETELAQDVALRRNAEAVSTEQAVRDLRPGWTEDEITDEVDRIKADTPAPPSIGVPSAVRLNLGGDSKV